MREAYKPGGELKTNTLGGHNNITKTIAHEQGKLTR